MIFSYFLSFIRENRFKMTLLFFCLAIYFGLLIISITFNRAIPQIARLPLQNIGVQTIIQKTGEIPGQMVDAIFPHSNAPISREQFHKLRELPFVEDSDMGLFFWYFDRIFFKAALGVHPDNGLLASILKRNITSGTYSLQNRNILLTAGFSTKHELDIGDTLSMGNDIFTVAGILRPNISGNIIPADIYMSFDDSLTVVRKSKEMQSVYGFGNSDFGNVVLLKTNPEWQGDKDKLVTYIDNKLLVFSEKTFTKEISEQLGLISIAGRFLFLIFGAILVVAFGLMCIYTLKTREREISILRMIGWRISDLKKQFIGENLIILLTTLITGSVIAFLGLLGLSRVTISMELPWDISARPHFLPEENAIDRIVSARLPLELEPWIFISSALGFILLFLLISFISFGRIKRIKVYEKMR